MASYSHSRLSTFQQCPYKYKLQYIDKVKVDIPTTIEMFMGDMVHRALERLYRERQKGAIPPLQEVLHYLFKQWTQEYTDDILIVKKGLGGKDYLNMATQIVSTFYETHHPFDARKVIGLETTEFLPLNEQHRYHVRIDRLDTDGDGTYYVCDYKTSNSMKSQGEADEDRQLAMYSLWVKDHFPDAKRIKLVWYMLKHNTQVISSRTEEQLETLKQDVLNLIKEIETATDYPTRPSALCRWCVFQNICPEFDTKNRGRQVSMNSFF